MQDDDDLDWDYYEYGASEELERERMKGIAKFDKLTVFRDPSFKDDEYNHFKISPHLDDLHESYGILAHDSDLVKQAGNLKNAEKQEFQIKDKISQAKIPGCAQNQVLNKDEDKRTKSGSVVATFPNTAIGVVLVTFKSGVKQRGTGCMCSPNHVITAGHVLISEDGSDVQNVQYFPGVVKNQTVYKEPKVIKAIVLDKKITHENDIGILIIDQPLGLYCGWFGLVYLPTEILKPLKLELVGYPVDKQEGEELFQFKDEGKLEHVKENSFTYKIEATGGQNGSPIFTERVLSENDIEPYIVGLHIGASKDNNNIGVRFCKNTLNTVREMIEFHFIHDSLQEEFFNCQIADQTIYVGDLDDCNTTLKISADLMFAVRNNLNLKDLQLRIKNKKNQPAINDAGMKELADSLVQIRHLENLKLDLFGCDNLTDQGLKHLGHALGELKDLKNLLLTINSNKKFSNNGIRDLTNNFAGLKSLENLSFFLHNLKSIDDNAGKFVGAGIQRIPNLQSLKLDFQMVSKMSEKGVQQVTTSVEQCKYLKKVNFSFMGMSIPLKLKQDIKRRLSFVKQVSVV